VLRCRNWSDDKRGTETVFSAVNEFSS